MTQSLSFRHFGSATVLAIGVMLCSGHVNAQMTSIDAAVSAATQWVALADANQAERMWTASGAIMQKTISKEEWAKYLTDLRNELGALDGREWAQVVRVGQPANLPKGEYVNVIFASRFDKAPTAESVSLMQAGSRWVPVGYVVRKIQPAASAPAAPPAK